MSDLTTYLDEVQARVDAATEGPWEAGVEQGLFGPMFVLRAGDGRAVSFRRPFDGGVTADAEFIAHARSDVPRLLAAVRAVLYLLDLNADPKVNLAGYIPVVSKASVFYALTSALTEEVGGRG